MNVHSVSATTTAREERGDKRERILEAALECFAERGFHGTPVPDIAARAKVGAGTIYRYFESKEALVNAVYRLWKQSLLDAVLRDFPASAPPRAQWRALFRGVVAFGKEHPLAFEFLESHHHAPYLDAQSRELEERIMQMGRAFLEASRASQVTRDCPSMILVALVWGGVVRFVRSGHEGLLELDEATTDRFESLCWEALRA